MFIELIKRHNGLEEKIKEQDAMLAKAEGYIANYIEILKNIEKIQSPQLLLLKTYARDVNVYGIIVSDSYESNFGDTIYEFSLYTYKINSCTDCNNWVTKSDIEIHKTNNGIEVEIVNIDTRNELRKGHATKQLQLIIYLSKVFHVKEIYGKLFLQTHIGADNLRKFYCQNGFEVGSSSFRMIL